MVTMRGVRMPLTLEGREVQKKERRDRQWARDHYRSWQPIDPSWSSSIKDECQKINAEMGATTRALDED